MQLSDEDIIQKAIWYIETKGKANLTHILANDFSYEDSLNNRADNIASQMEYTGKYVIYSLSNYGTTHHILVKRNPNYELNERLKDTYKSNRDLNTSTKIFYDKQDSYSKVQRNLTYIIAFSSGIYTLFAILTFFKDCRPNTHQELKRQLLQPKSQQSEKTGQFLKGNDSLKKK